MSLSTGSPKADRSGWATAEVTPAQLQAFLVTGEGAATADSLEGGLVPICVQPPAARR